MTLKAFTFTKTFLEEKCDYCGDCFHKCPVLQWPVDMARAEIRALVETGHSRVLEQCTGCMACNSLCPTGANPHTLIVSRWQERYRREGIPPRGRLVLPYHKPNLYTVALERLPEDEKKLVREWEANWRHPPEADTMLYAGCNALLQPFLLDTGLFDGIPIFGSLDLCCGEPFYRMGCWDAVRTIAQRLEEKFRRMGFKQLIMPCLAGYHLFKHVYRDVFGVSFDFEVVSVLDWLLDRIECGQLHVHRLDKTAVMHDSCWDKASGGHVFDQSRALLEALGVAVVEPAHTREVALCCGMCAPAARFRLGDAYRAAKQRLEELEAAPADMVVEYCGGCNWLFALAKRSPTVSCTTPIYHLLEVVQMATGETPKHRTDARAQSIASAMAGRLLRSYAARKRFWIEDIAGRPVEATESPEREE